MHENFFNSRYPILEACMNGGSSLDLALACWDAGVFPSLFCQYWAEEGDNRYSIIEETLKKFKKITGSCDIVLALDEKDLFDIKMINVIKDSKISHLEIFAKNIKNINEYQHLFNIFGKKYEEQLLKILKKLHPIKFIWRVTNIPLKEKNFYHIPLHQENFAYGLKGSDSAGVNGKHTTMELFLTYKKINPYAATLIPYGGIGTPKQVNEYISGGAIAVSIGTLFASSKESPLSLETKKIMVNSDKNNVIKLENTDQNSLVIGDIEDVYQDNSAWNRTESLKKGLYGDGKQGHIYVGSAVEHITEIKSVKEIVEYLVSELPKKL